MNDHQSDLVLPEKGENVEINDKETFTNRENLCPMHLTFDNIYYVNLNIY